MLPHHDQLEPSHYTNMTIPHYPHAKIIIQLQADKKRQDKTNNQAPNVGFNVWIWNLDGPTQNHADENSKTNPAATLLNSKTK